SAMINIPANAATVTDRQVKEVNFWSGAEVKQGDVLMTFEPALFELTVQQRKAMVAQAKEGLLAYQKLYQQKAASAMQVKEAELAVETAELELAMAEQDLQLCTIASPID